MSIGPILNGTFLMGGVDLAAFTNQFSLDVDVDALDKTNFASSGWKELAGGLKASPWTFNGFLDPTVAEPLTIFHNPSDADPGVMLAGELDPIPVMAALTRPVADEDVAFMIRAMRAKVSHGAQIGQLAAYTLNLQADSPMVRGVVLGAVSGTVASDTTDGFEVDDVSAVQKVYASLHVTSTAADTLDVTIESDADGLFGSPTTRITFAQVDGSAVSYASEYKTLVGPITDTFWRVNWTLGAAGPFSFTVFLAIAT